jgi:YidC/Oxa1 family membrane protein insertase
MDQNRNIIIALAISFAILFGLPLLFPKAPPPPVPPAQQADNSAPTPSQPTPGQPAPSQPAPIPVAAAVRPRPEVLAETPRVKIVTPRVVGSIALSGARLDDLTLVEYRETVDPSSPKIDLLSPDGSEHPYFVDFGWEGAKGAAVKTPDEKTRWTASAEQLTPQHPVDLSWDNGDGLRFIIRYAIDENYMLTVTQTVANGTDTPVSLFPFGRIERIGEVPMSGYTILHEGPIAVLNGALHDGGWFLAPDKYNYADVKKAPLTETSVGGWLGFTDKYWLTTLIPDQHETVHTEVSHGAEGNRDIYLAMYRGSEHVVPAKDKAMVEDRLFAGAKKVDLLDTYETQLDIPKFDRTIDFGLFYWITKPIFLALDFFFKLIGNFGVAILLLTIIIKGAFFPLQSKSYRAMSKMKALQPEMAKLRERYGDDKPRLNQEMMGLYKRAGANPMAGCLPIFIQIPVFFSLYKVLYVTIEMRQQPFFGWIRDLSAPDPTTFVNLFGLLPFTPPEHLNLLLFSLPLNIGVWPLIMGVTMFLQQKLTPQASMDPVQARMFMFLPVIFTFMLSQFAAGLVIYWAWNNLLSITQQWFIMRRSAAAAPPKA